ncbi:hypothetical protein Ait01nite_092410 [Actinoplanes italicus]|uniref:Putative secreted protein with PEP-CTERM sorting signal n=1 Tax=Actinoplanes italicus TaxID=113567 RepID=A0A2T0K2K6_9ACTN|nr:hypothetical protein [Actinoplanes italicus]PRX17065.1 putative secreted protein with PEP-CTERM sorting signal [Actinoplanes italicus]GIE36196.1 hypothetical protein Ait01nite_092410 [Actinoplanes italicus]
MWIEQRIRRAWHAAVLVLVLGAAWMALLGVGHGHRFTAGEPKRVTASAAMPQPAAPLVRETRLTGKPIPSTLLLFAALIAALLLGVRRHRWPVAAPASATATPAALLSTFRGRAPPRLPA